MQVWPRVKERGEKVGGHVPDWQLSQGRLNAAVREYSKSATQRSLKLSSNEPSLVFLWHISEEAAQGSRKLCSQQLKICQMCSHRFHKQSSILYGLISFMSQREIKMSALPHIVPMKILWVNLCQNINNGKLGIANVRKIKERINGKRK